MTNRTEEEPTPTQEIWKDKESNLQKKHKAAVMDLYFAVHGGIKAEIDSAIQKIKDIETLQAQAHAAALRHAVKKTYNKVVNQRANAAR
jgi:hypothetical protein